jgi:diaminopimelate decarboxylase
MIPAIRREIKEIETPFYIYDEDRIAKNIAFLKRAFSGCDADLFYAVKANDSVAILKKICSEGVGAEAVSPGEIFLSRKAGFKPGRIIYNNVARKRDEIEYAIKQGVSRFNFEALDQALLLEQTACRLKKRIALFVRVNPGIYPKTHSHLSTGAPLSKFGIEEKQLKEVARFARMSRFTRLVGIHSHIGSQILTPKPFVQAARNGVRILSFFRAKGIDIEYLNFGGGFGIPYHPGEVPLDFNPIAMEYGRIAQSCKVKILLEPGRFIVGNSGIIVTKVISRKKRNGTNLCIVDADMTENPRPAIYRAYHHIEPLTTKKSRRRKTRIAGPLCENSNEFGTYLLPKLEVDDYLMIFNSGAYTRTMSSNYNGRLLSPEYSIKRGTLRKIRTRQLLTNLMEHERY